MIEKFLDWSLTKVGSAIAISLGRIDIDTIDVFCVLFLVLSVSFILGRKVSK